MPPELRLFGGVSVLADGKAVSGAATQPRRIAVLAVLAESFPAPVTRERIIGLIWPEQDDASARRLLTQAIYELRRELGPLIASGAGRDLLLDASALDVDLVQFRRAVIELDAERAVALHRAPFLDGFHLRDSAEFERWTDAVRETSRRDLRRTIEAALAQREAAGDVKDAARWADRLVDATPHDAPNVIRAIDLFERAGDPGAAARVAATYERRMREDLELPPDAAVARRNARIGQEGHSASVLDAASSGAARSSASDGAFDSAVDVGARSDVVAPAIHSTPGSSRSAVTARRRTFGAAIAGIAALAVAALGVRALQRSHAGDTTHDVIAVRPFTAHGGDAAAHSASSIASLLVGNLDDAGGTEVDTTASAPGARTLSGAVVVLGSEVRIDATLAPRRDGEPEIRASVTGSADSLVTLVERLSLELLPELYSNLDPAARRDVVRRLRSVAAARAYLDGESALNRAAFDSAYDALRFATQADSGNAFLWYRRAVAAEEVHHIDDADRSATYADERRALLSPRESRLVHAYRVWRTGDTRAADSLYREILRTRPMDAEAWFHFAEVSYHGGPLVGRPLDDARDAWRRAVALDSNSFPALMHAIRLEARAGDDASLRALLARAERVRAREPYISEARAIAASGSGPRAFGRDDLRRLDEMPDASLQFVHAMIAGFVERPDLAMQAAARLVGTARPDAVRAEGYSALAHVAMSQGQTRVAEAMLDSLGRRNAIKASWSRSYFATLPFMARDSAVAARALHELSLAPPRATEAPLYLELSTDASAATMIHRYTSALLAARAGDRVERSLGCADIPAGPSHELCTDLEHGIGAELLEHAGRHDAALRELEAMSMRVPYQLAGRSVYYARTRERFLRAQLLERVGRLDEAYDWYAAAPHAARLDYIYLAPSHLGRARVRERKGDAKGAATHYARALELLADSDVGAAALKREAAEGLARTTR